jgi:ADP-ribosylglycohydrolase
MPQALQLPLLCLGVTMSSDGKEDNYAQCVRESIRLCGCTASRSIYVGAICAALQDTNNKLVLGVPEDWVARLAEPERMKDLAVKVASCHGVIPFK